MIKILKSEIEVTVTFVNDKESNDSFIRNETIMGLGNCGSQPLKAALKKIVRWLAANGEQEEVAALVAAVLEDRQMFDKQEVLAIQLIKTPGDWVTYVTSH
jgi:hypothetical protein